LKEKGIKQEKKVKLIIYMANHKDQIFPNVRIIRTSKYLTEKLLFSE
jgi:hypothetical protein